MPELGDVRVAQPVGLDERGHQGLGAAAEKAMHQAAHGPVVVFLLTDPGTVVKDLALLLLQHALGDQALDQGLDRGGLPALALLEKLADLGDGQGVPRLPEDAHDLQFGFGDFFG